MSKKKEALKSVKIVVQQYASPIRRDGVQKLYLKSLGLGKMNRIRELEDTPSIRGLLRKAAHLVKIIS